MKPTRLIQFGLLILTVVTSGAAAAAHAAEFTLVTGVDAGLSLGPSRAVLAVPGPSAAPGFFADGDRLAGTADVGSMVMYAGTGTPLLSPNQFGTLSAMFRRGTIPAGPAGFIPLQGIDFLGGPLIDLDGDPGNGQRSLVPVSGQSAVLLPGTASTIELAPDFARGLITVIEADMTGTNEGGPGIGPEVANTVNVLAGTSTGAQPGPAINPTIDTRQGTLTAFTGGSGTLPGVYRIENLGYEIWQDSLLDSPTTGPFLGTFQFLGSMRGWLVVRSSTGSFPGLGGEGLGSTLWSAVDVSRVGSMFNTAHGAPTAVIGDGTAADQYSAPNNGGVALADFGGDIGAYFDSVVVPALPPDATSFVYLESAGIGINNSFDPVFGDTNGYDVVLVASSNCVVLPGSAGDSDGNGALDACEGIAVPALSGAGSVILCLAMIAASIVVLMRRRPSVVSAA